jgi:hypothetical protein
MFLRIAMIHNSRFYTDQLCAVDIQYSNSIFFDSIERLERCLLMMGHLPAACRAICRPLQHPYARTYSPVRPIVFCHFYAIIDQSAVLAQYDHFIMTEFIRLPDREKLVFQHCMKWWVGYRCEDKITRKDPDWIAREKREEVGARTTMGCPGFVFERAYRGGQRRVGKRRGRHCGLGCRNYSTRS